ncbi:STAS domain-containing protein [Streptomyces sp. SM1P]
MVPSLQLDTRVAPGCTTLVISGECDQDDVQVLEQALTVVVEDSPPVLIVDVSRLLFGDSVLLHFLLSAQRAQTAAGGGWRSGGPSLLRWSACCGRRAPMRPSPSRVPGTRREPVTRCGVRPGSCVGLRRGSGVLPVR